MNSKNATENQQDNQNEPAQSSKQDSVITESNFVTLNPRFQADTVTPCPYCQQMSLETAYQPPLVPTRGTGYTLCHCRNPQCQQYGATLNAEQYRKQAALEHLAAQLAAHLKAQEGNSHE